MCAHTQTPETNTQLELQVSQSDSLPPLKHKAHTDVCITWPALIQSVKALLLVKNMRSCCQREEVVEGEEEAGEEVEGEEV